jgi:hypothetical protein
MAASPQTGTRTMLLRPHTHWLVAVFAVALFFPSATARAQTAKPEMRESCPGLVASHAPRVTRASLRLAALAADQVRISYAGHSTFLIESPQSVRIATDITIMCRCRGYPPSRQ